MSTLRGSGNNIPSAGAHHPRVPARAEAALRGPVRLRGGMGQDRARRGSDPLPPTGQWQWQDVTYGEWKEYPDSIKQFLSNN